MKAFLFRDNRTLILIFSLLILFMVNGITAEETSSGELPIGYDDRSFYLMGGAVSMAGTYSQTLTIGFDKKDKTLLFTQPSMPSLRLCVNPYINTPCCAASS